jgi:hypothetical protein
MIHTIYNNHEKEKSFDRLIGKSSWMSDVEKVNSKDQHLQFLQLALVTNMFLFLFTMIERLILPSMFLEFSYH